MHGDYEYRKMLSRVRRGIKPNRADFHHACLLAAKSPLDVFHDLTDDEAPRDAIWNGDECEFCGGTIRVVSTRKVDLWLIRRIECRSCGQRFPDLVLRRKTHARDAGPDPG